MLEAVALLALIMATASLSIQITLLLQKRKEGKAEATPASELMTVSSEELAAFEKDPTKNLANPPGKTVDDHFNEAFASSDDDFTGIDDSFGV